MLGAMRSERIVRKGLYGILISSSLAALETAISVDRGNQDQVVLEGAGGDVFKEIR